MDKERDENHGATKIGRQIQKIQINIQKRWARNCEKYMNTKQKFLPFYFLGHNSIAISTIRLYLACHSLNDLEIHSYLTK